ncbi:MAG: relaxase/mobilization nuclease domain-containing protein [Chitinophagaceae bacterium]
MIIKQLSRKSSTMTTASGGLLKYLFRYALDEKKTKGKGDGEKLLTVLKGNLIIRHNVRSRTSIQGFIKEFNQNESYRLVHRKDRVKVFHTIISFAPGDRHLITDEMLKDIAKRYIEERAPNCLWVGSKHEDCDHLHIHLCQSGTMLNGRSAWVSNQKFKSIKLALDRYQRETYPFLVHSLPDYEKTKKQTKEVMIERLKANRQTNKAVLLETIEKLYAEARSQKEFLAGLKAKGHHVYERNGRPQGILFEGKTKYRFSALGFDQEKIGLLDKCKAIEEPVTMTKPIPAVQRVKPTKQKQRELENREALAKELEALSAIRARAQEKERVKDLDSPGEREIDRPDFEYENVVESWYEEPVLEVD